MAVDRPASDAASSSGPPGGCVPAAGRPSPNSAGTQGQSAANRQELDADLELPENRLSLGLSDLLEDDGGKTSRRFRQELSADHPTRRRVEAGSAAAHAAMPSVRLHLPDQEVPMMVFDETQMPDNPTWHDLLGALERSGFNRAAVLLESWADEYLNDLDSPLRGDDE